MNIKLFPMALATLLLSFTSVSNALSLGESMKINDPDTGYGINADYLYTQNFEMGYFDHWLGQNFGGLVKIQSDGKVGLFIGILKLDCKNKTFKWEKAVSRTDDSKSPMTAKEIKASVPLQVTKNALALYCKK